MEGICRSLNPLARIVRAEKGVVPLNDILNTGLFDMARAQSAAGWRQALELLKPKNMASQASSIAPLQGLFLAGDAPGFRRKLVAGGRSDDQ